MRFFADQDVFAETVRFLRGLGHDVLTAYEAKMSDADDTDILLAAANDDRMLITRDRDFGNLVFVKELKGGVLYLRLTPSTVDSIHTELNRVLTLYSEPELKSSFVVIEAGRHRIRRSP